MPPPQATQCGVCAHARRSRSKSRRLSSIDSADASLDASLDNVQVDIPFGSSRTPTVELSLDEDKVGACSNNGKGPELLARVSLRLCRSAAATDISARNPYPWTAGVSEAVKFFRGDLC